MRLAAVLCGLLPLARVHAAIEVTVEPPTVARVEFEPDQPPREMPPAGADGGAVCSNVFEIEASFSSAVDVLSPTNVRVYPAAFDITTRLKVTIYLPKGTPEELRAHEEGHRTIGEHYYAAAEAAAREAATSLVGRAFEGRGDDRPAAEQAAGHLVIAALKDEFMRRTHARSAAANARYDALTDHGRSEIVAADAVQAAIAQDP